MNLANFIPAVLGILGLEKFNQVDGKDCLSAEECARLKSYGFSDTFLTDMNAHLANPGGDKPQENRQMAAVAAALAQTTTQLEARTAELETLRQNQTADRAAIAQREATIAELRERVGILSALPDEAPAQGITGAGAPAFNLNDEQQLGGMAGEFFSLDRAYNQRARAALLASEGRSLLVNTEAKVDYKTLQDDLGAFYRTPWRQRLQSFLVALPTITKIFPTESGHQDLDTLVNIWLGEFSQADSSAESDFSKVTKGSFEFGHETLRMYDVMFAYTFRNLKTLEKSWIGYLNKEGSSPLKLSFIEYLLVELAKALQNERELRWVNGVRKNPEPDEPGVAMAAADGVYEYLRKRIDGHVDFTPNGGMTGKTVYQIKPFVLGEITQANIGEVFFQGTSQIPSKFRDTGKLVLYIPSFMLPWYHKYNETHYGQNTDYKAGINYVKEFPAVRIETIPNADNHHRIFWTIEGNIKTYEHVAGEMLKFELEQHDWSMKCWSNWKEGIAAEAVGYKYTDRAEMDGSRQLIWANEYDRPSTYFLESEPNANPDALLHNSIVTVANNGTYAITDVENATVGQVVTIKCGADGEHGVTIKKSGKFSLLSADWTPEKGDTISVMKRADGKFVEVNRATAASNSYQFAADATAPSVKDATVFVTHENTKATALTNLEDAVVGTVYTIHGAGSTNATTIANGGNFVLTAGMTLKAGKYIQLVKTDDGKFYEVARS